MEVLDAWSMSAVILVVVTTNSYLPRGLEQSHFHAKCFVGAEAYRLALLSPDVADKSMDVILGAYLYWEGICCFSEIQV